MSKNNTLQVTIVSAERQIYAGLAQMVNISGEMGELGLAPGHSPLLTCIKPGGVRVRESGSKEEEIFYISGGILEVQSSTVTVLADTVERAADIDETAAIEAKDRAEKALEDRKSDVEYASALIELARATAQLRAIKDLRKRAR